jgi:hypothetical protein
VRIGQNKNKIGIRFIHGKHIDWTPPLSNIARKLGGATG